MSRNSKIALAIIGIVLVFCCIGAILAYTFLPRLAANFADQALADDPERAAEVGRAILDYELPPGFQEETAMEILGTRMVFISGRGMTITLMQLPAAGGDQEEMEQQMQRAFAGRQDFGNVSLEFVESEEITINGRSATLSTREGTTEEDGARLRQQTAVFDVDDGTGMLMIVGDVAGWDETAVDQFLESIE